MDVLVHIIKDVLVHILKDVLVHIAPSLPVMASFAQSAHYLIAFLYGISFFFSVQLLSQ